MSEQRCGNCRFWGRPRDAGGIYRPCTAVIHDKAGDLSNDQTDEAVCEQWPEDYKAEVRANRAAAEASQVKALVKDGSGYYAALKTRDDFGCVLFEPGEP